MNEISQKVAERAYEIGYVFGKYTQQVLLEEDLLKEIDNSNKLLNIYLENFNNGVKSGMSDTHRSA